MACMGSPQAQARFYNRYYGGGRWRSDYDNAGSEMSGLDESKMRLPMLDLWGKYNLPRAERASNRFSGTDCVGNRLCPAVSYSLYCNLLDCCHHRVFIIWMLILILRIITMDSPNVKSREKDD